MTVLAGLAMPRAEAMGATIRQAATEAAQQRFRAVMMTALSFLLGVVPLIVASGAGAASQQAIGVAVVGGMAAATIMSLSFTPAFYVVMKRLAEGKKTAVAAPETTD